MQVITSATPMPTASSGFTFMPSVSSSKNLSRPALWAGMGDLLSRFFSLFLLMAVSLSFTLDVADVLLIKVVSFCL